MYHCAGNVKAWNNWNDHLRINVEGTKNALKAAKVKQQIITLVKKEGQRCVLIHAIYYSSSSSIQEVGIKRFVHVSTESVFATKDALIKDYDDHHPLPNCKYIHIYNYKHNMAISYSYFRNSRPSSYDLSSFFSLFIYSSLVKDSLYMYPRSKLMAELAVQDFVAKEKTSNNNNKMDVVIVRPR